MSNKIALAILGDDRENKFVCNESLTQILQDRLFHVTDGTVADLRHKL